MRLTGAPNTATLWEHMLKKSNRRNKDRALYKTETLERDEAKGINPRPAKIWLRRMTHVHSSFEYQSWPTIHWYFDCRLKFGRLCKYLLRVGFGAVWEEAIDRSEQEAVPYGGQSTLVLRHCREPVNAPSSVSCPHSLGPWDIQSGSVWWFLSFYSCTCSPLVFYCFASICVDLNSVFLVIGNSTI